MKNIAIMIRQVLAGKDKASVRRSTPKRDDDMFDAKAQQDSGFQYPYCLEKGSYDTFLTNRKGIARPLATAAMKMRVQMPSRASHPG